MLYCYVMGYFFHRCEGRTDELQSSQQSISVELGEKQSLCQQLRSTVDTMAAQLTQAEETKKQVLLILYYSMLNIYSEMNVIITDCIV